jgi:hypothetical protein
MRDILMLRLLLDHDSIIPGDKEDGKGRCPAKEDAPMTNIEPVPKG